MDIKPGNILLDGKLNARVGDPGMARKIEPGVTHASISEIVGTQGYIDPFLLDGDPRHVKPENDVFSFGVGQYDVNIGNINFGNNMAVCIEYVVSVKR